MRTAAGLPSIVFGLIAAWSTGASLAGRPLSVDDASVNAPGAGHVEAWSAREPGRVRSWTLAPAYGLREGIELGASWTRDATNRLHTTALQAKLQWTAAQARGCHAGTVFGLAHTSARGNDSSNSGNTPYLNGLLTCNHDALALHANLGATRPAGGPTSPTWGLALERAWGPLTWHAEGFGQRHAKPVFQIGVRTEVAKDIQLDGTLGRHGRSAVYSAGLKFGF